MEHTIQLRKEGVVFLSSKLLLCNARAAAHWHVTSLIQHVSFSLPDQPVLWRDQCLQALAVPAGMC
jgi:hypothetical protein